MTLALLCLFLGAYWNLTRIGEGGDDLSNPDQIRTRPPFSINRPRVFSAAEVIVDDDETVIGITVGARHRAYILHAFYGNPMVHVVNDVIGQDAVSISVCDRTGCCQVFDEPNQKDPLKLAFGGWRDGQMMLRTPDGLYYIESLDAVRAEDKPFRFSALQFEKTTWKKWKEAHPDTDIYVKPERKSVSVEF